MFKKPYLILIILFLLFENFTISQAQPDDKQLQLWNSFKAKHGNGWKVNWDQKLGIPEIISMGKTKPYSGDSLEIAKNFLKENNDLFKMKKDLSDLKIMDSKRYLDLTHITFKQFYKDIEVEKSDFLVHILPTGEIMMANGKYFSDIKISTKPSITLNDAMKIAEKEIKGKFIPNSTFENKLVIYPDEDYTYHLSWKFLVVTDEPRSTWIYYVDANDGKIIYKVDALFTYSYNMNKKNTMNPNYSINIGLVKDKSKKLLEEYDMIGASFYPISPNASQYTVEQVPISSSWTTLHWNGLAVHNDKYGDANLSNNNGNFVYDITDNHFDDANVYALLMRDGGYRNGSVLPHWSGNIYVHSTLYNSNYNYNNSGYNLADNTIQFGDASDFAKDASVVFHEYNHASIMSYVKPMLGLYEYDSRGINEGLADYFSCMFLNNPIIGEYVGIGRNAENPELYTYQSFPLAVFKFDNSVNYKIGTLLCHILWTLRNSITSGTVLSTVYSITPYGSVPDFRNVLIGIDGGNHTDEIILEFWNHGIPSGPMPKANNYGNSIQLVEERNSNQMSIYSLNQNYPNPFNPSTVISYQLPDNSFVTLKIYNVLGKEITTLVNEYQTAGTHNVSWEPKTTQGALPSGIYYYKIQTGNYRDVKKMLYIR